MSIGLKTHKLLWGKSGNRCAKEDCRHELIADETETDDESVIGDEAHIVAKSEDGPRGISPLSSEDRDKYDNLILLCRIHHKIVDDQPGEYTVEKLRKMKKEHENWVSKSLTIDHAKLKDELAYASYIEEILKLADFDNWDKWSSSLVSHGQPSISRNRIRELQKIPTYIISRFWPNRYIELEESFYNFKNVLNDLTKVFFKHCEEETENDETGDRFLWTEKFYRIREWDDELYHRLLKDFEYHVYLVEDLTLELTRAGNLICERIRQTMYPKFRELEGKLLIVSGPFMDMSWSTYKVEYKKEEKLNKFPYPGLKQFMTDRENRDLNLGKGYDKRYFPGR